MKFKNLKPEKKKELLKKLKEKIIVYNKLMKNGL